MLTKAKEDHYIELLGKPREAGGNNQFYQAMREPTFHERKKMIALAVSSTINECMGNHYYTFGGGIYKQSDGGTIGTDIAGEIARNVMSVWDAIFMKKLKTAGIHMDMYKCYVDDQLDIYPPVNPG